MKLLTLPLVILGFGMCALMIAGMGLAFYTFFDWRSMVAAIPVALAALLVAKVLK